MTPFDAFESTWQTGSFPEALEQLGQYLIAEQRFPELFELRKVQLRLHLGLPVEQWQPIDELPAQQGVLLENGLLEICREIGSRMVRSGDLAGGWSFLEPVGDKELVRELLAEIPVTDDNAEAMVHIGIGAGIDPSRGFQVVLDRFGTCSAITTYETRLAGMSLESRRGPAGLLVQHVYHELLENVRQAIARSGQLEPATNQDGPGTLRKLTLDHPGLTDGLNHQIDTTHLASTVRISKILDDPAIIELAIELAEYGNRLHEDFQYPGVPPFTSTYSDTLEFLRALLGRHTDVALIRLGDVARRQREAGVLDSSAWYVYLLDRLGRGEAAIEAWLELLHQVGDDAVLNEEVAPTLQQLVRRYRLFPPATAVLRERGDLLGFAMVAAAQFQDAHPEYGDTKKRPVSS